jgi:hypothetical protein
MSDSQSVEFALTAQDYVAYTRMTLKRSIWTKLVFWCPLILLLMIGLQACVMYSATGALGINADEIPALLILVAMLFFSPIMGVVSRLRFQSAGFAKFRKPVRVEISPAGIRSTGGIADSLTPWSSVIDIVQTPAALYLFILKYNAHIVPRRAFADEAAFERFAATAQAYWRPAQTPA